MLDYVRHRKREVKVKDIGKPIFFLCSIAYTELNSFPPTAYSLINLPIDTSTYFSPSTIRGHPDPVLRAAPTGVAAYNIHGSMLHQLLSLPVNRPWYELGGEKLAAMQVEFRRCKLLIIDEKSMIEFKMLHQIDIRLRSIMACPDVFFGGTPNLLFCSLAL